MRDKRETVHINQTKSEVGVSRRRVAARRGAPSGPVTNTDNPFSLPIHSLDLLRFLVVGHQPNFEFVVLFVVVDHALFDEDAVFAQADLIFELVLDGECMESDERRPEVFDVLRARNAWRAGPRCGIQRVD